MLVIAIATVTVADGDTSLDTLRIYAEVVSPKRYKIEGKIAMAVKSARQPLLAKLLFPECITAITGLSLLEVLLLADKCHN